MRIRLQLDAGLLMLMSLVAVVMPNAEDDGAQQHARNEENELPEMDEEPEENAVPTSEDEKEDLENDSNL